MSNNFMKEVVLTTSTVPTASPCKVTHADGTTSIIEAIKSDFNYGDSTTTKTGGKANQSLLYYINKEYGE